MIPPPNITNICEKRTLEVVSMLIQKKPISANKHVKIIILETNRK